MNVNMINKEFVFKVNELLTKIQKDSLVTTKLYSAFNKDIDYIDESLDICNTAQIAEDEYEKETKEAAEAKEVFEKKYEAALINYTKHTAFLKLLLKHEIKKQEELGIIGQEVTRNKEEWFAHAVDVYERVTGDSEAVELMGTYNFRLVDLLQGLQTIIAAREANDTLAKVSAEVKSAIFNRDVAYKDLYDRVQVIQLCCYYALLQAPEKYKELGLPISIMKLGSSSIW